MAAAGRTSSATRTGSRDALEQLPPGRHCFEFRHESWFTDDVLAILRAYGAALVYGDHPERPWQPLELTDRLDLRALPLRRAAGGAATTPRPSCASGPSRLREVRREAEVFAYFNNDWEAFAPRNALRLRAMLEER